MLYDAAYIFKNPSAKNASSLNASVFCTPTLLTIHKSMIPLYA